MAKDQQRRDGQSENDQQRRRTIWECHNGHREKQPDRYGCQQKPFLH